MTDFFATAGSAGLVDLVVRATILLFVSLSLQCALRKGPAVTRHRLWTLTFVLLLALPALRQFGPSWNVPLLPGAERPSDRAHGLVVADSLVQAESGAVAPFGSLTVGPSGRGKPEVTSAGSWIWLVFVLWVAGSGIAFVSLGVGARRFSRLVQDGQLVDDEASLHELDALRQRLSTRAKVRLVLTEEAVTPMTGGVRRPVILLPASATDWSEACRQAVLAHELVHVRRRDALRQLLARVVLAVYWFHPLSWMALHLASAQREEACDEEVLAAGARPSEYAGHLLSLAEIGLLRRPALSLPMAQQSQVERRIRAILNPGRPRPRALVATVTLAVATVGGVSVSITNPIRSEDAPAVVENVAGVGATALHCVPVSEADELAGWDFGHGLGEVLVCTIQSETATTASGGVRTIEPAAWGALEGEIRKHLEQRSVVSP